VEKASSNATAKHKEWNARIVEQIPGQHIAWRAKPARTSRELVNFQAESPN